MITIINIKLLKNNEEILNNTVDYSKEFDKILFEVDGMNCYIIKKEDEITFQRENDEYRFNLVIGNNNKCELYLKDKDLLFPIQVDDGSFEIIDNKIIIYYLLESLDEANTIEITIEG